MFLTLTCEGEPGVDARDLGHLLHKHPDRVQRFELSVGEAHVCYPEATPERCTVALLLEVDPVAMVRGRRFTGSSASLGQYVNDRPYAASSMLAVAVGKVFSTALAGVCKHRPELPDRELDLLVHVPAVPCRGGAELAVRLFESLGWQVTAEPQPLDPELPEWGMSRYVDLTLRGRLRVADALAHLYLLLPVLDGSKHYWVTSDDIDKLVRRGGSWLAGHPERTLITRRYLAHRRRWVDDATARLDALDDAAPTEELTDADVASTSEEAEEVFVPLVRHRKDAVLRALHDVSARRVVDLGCGPGSLLVEMLDDSAFSEILGVDVSAADLDRAARRLRLDRMPVRRRERIELVQSSATYRDDRIAGFDAVVLMEVVEHLDPDRLPALERSVFAHARPRAVVVTTPNSEHNVRYDGLAAGAFRHPDHRFEWSRAEFATWAERVAAEHGYAVRLRPVGADDPEVGPPTQLALFTRETEHETESKHETSPAEGGTR